MRIATAEDVVALEMLAIELELARAVSIVDMIGDSAACALFDRREILETGHTARLPLNEIGQRIDTGHERVEDPLETLTIAGFHWKWSERPKAAYTRETSRVPNAGDVLQHSRVFVAVAHD